MTTKQSEQLTAGEFLEKLETFLRDTIGDNWQFDWRGEEDGAIDFRTFWVWGLKDENEDEDGDYIPEPYPYTHPIREVSSYSKIKKYKEVK